MDNANKAIIMAFGMLVAVMIMATIVFVFTKLATLPTQDDSLEEVEQRRLFNQEYEVYDKKIMYGVDIISVLNKAQSNNEKYVKSKFFSGTGYNTDYAINIVVTFKHALQETMTVTYLNTTANGVVETEYAGTGPRGVLAKDVFKQPSTRYQNFIYPTSSIWNALQLKSQTINTTVTAGTYQLLSGSSISKPDSGGYTHYTDAMLEGDSTLRQLITQSATMSQTVRNTGTNKNEYEVGWNQATWYPAIYDMKTKKFKCEGKSTVYSAKTGRIVYMEFTEV